MGAVSIFGISLLLAIAAFTLVGRFTLVGNSAEEKLVELAKREGWMTQARLVDSFRDHYNPDRSRPGVMDSVSVIYEYYVAGERYTSNQYFESTSGVAEYPVETIAFYDRDDPKHHVLACQDLVGMRGKKGCFITCGAALLTFIVTANALASMLGVDVLSASYG